MSKLKNILLKIIVELSRFILGLTFVFSGFVKSIDPLGTSYKIQDYLTAFDLSNLHNLALPLSIFLCAGELCLGIFLLLGIYRKWTSYLLLIAMLLLTPLTLYLAISNPVDDCGCFGDAFIISNWETFYKNIILLFCSILVAVGYNKITRLFTHRFYWLVGLYVIVWSLMLCIYNVVYEPILDFRPYKTGVNINELLTVQNKNLPQYENIFIYEKDGKKQEFTENDYPWDDSTWVFVDRTSKVVNRGKEPVIADFTIDRLMFNQDKTKILSKEDVTPKILSDTSYTFLMISYSLKEANNEYLNNFEEISEYAKNNEYSFYCLTSSIDNEIIEQEQEYMTDFNFAQVDERTLKTIMRSNPGLVLIKNGVIINKWSGRRLFDTSMLNKPLDKLSISQIPNKDERIKTIIKNILVTFFIPIVGLKVCDLLFRRRRKKIN